MHEGEAIDEDGHIVAVLGRAARGGVLVHHLHMVVVDVAAVDKAYVLRLAIVEADVHDGVALYAFGLVLDIEIFIGYLLREQALPLGIAQADIVQLLQLCVEIVYQPLLSIDVQALIALRHELADETLLQCSLALIALHLVHRLLIVGHHREVALLDDDVEILN